MKGTFAYFVLLGLVFISCVDTESNVDFKIGFSQCVSGDQWRQSMHREMQRELLFYPEISFEIKDANGNNEIQAQHIREFIQEGVDLLIVSPNEADPITPLVEEAYNAGIPVITIDRKTSSDIYSSYVGADNREIGKTAGQYAESIITKGDKIIEIWGLKGSTPAIERHEGFAEYINSDEYQVIDVYSDWTRENARKKLSSVIDDNLDVDLIYAHNDGMAQAAFEVSQKKGIAERVKFIGIDGLPGPSGGLQLVQDGILDATLLYPTGGEEAIRLAYSILRGQPYQKDNILGTTLINSRNVRILKQQSDKILNQQRDIERQEKRLNNQVELYETQRSLVYILSAGILVVFGLVIYLYYTQREKQRINRELSEKNEKVISQQNEIIKYAKEAEEANAARFKFFTNISHEFRTPLTLILGPVEHLLKSSDLSIKYKTELELIRKNSYRMLRLINQLMEFRKIENGKIKLNASENNVVDFISEIVEAFRSLSKDKGIDLIFKSDDLRESIWFDVNMLDKVIFNLLSNSFKFTARGGFIKVSIHDNSDLISIVVEDNGRGMSKEHAEHAFDRFYQGEEYSSKGTGLGLSLAKELIELHKGSISLTSEKGLGSRFEIKLRKGKNHFDSSERVTLDKPIKHEGVEYVNQHANISFVANENLKTDHSILIIEDNDDLRAFIQEYFSRYFKVICADSGAKGFLLAQEEVPDLVICDLMLGDEDGLRITKKIKSDFRTSHIPIIILTAKSNDEQKVLGMKAGADQYITKPFNIEYLLESVNAHLKNRELLKKHFQVSDENELEESAELPLNLDQTFIKKFKALINEHIADPSANVDMFCHELGLSRVQLYRKVKALLGQSVNDYLNDVRLRNAKKLLHSDLSISEVAYQSGFSSPAYFSTAFKGKFKISPSEYKQNLLLNT